MINFAFRLANSGGERQRQNQQSEDDAEGDIEAAEHGGNQRTADTTNTEAEVNHAIVSPDY